MKIKRSFVLLLPTLILCSCSNVFNNASNNYGDDSKTSIMPENDNNANVSTREIPFVNLSNDFNITGKYIDTYFIDGSDVPYVDVLGFIRSMDGFINRGETLRYKYSPNSNMFSLKYYYNDNLSSYVQFQWDTNYIYVSDYSFFYRIIKSNQSTNYSSFIKNTKYESYSEKPVCFKLGSFYFDILYYNEKCLMPFVIANMLFCSQNQFNIYYNGTSYYGYYGEISTSSDAYKTIYTCDLNGTTQSKDMRRASLNSFLFAMDYFYGLKEDKGIGYFKNYISSYDTDLLWSTNAEDNMKAMRHIVFGQLDELHTRLDGRSMYSTNQGETLYSLFDCGTFWNDFYSLRKQQSQLRNETLGENVSLVRYSGDTAIITLDSFDTGSNNDIYDSDGEPKDSAWKYDSYFYMRHCMNDISKHSEVNDVVLDLSLNGGGNIGAMQRVLGFLTDKVLLDYEYDTLTNEYSCNHFKVDTDGDGYYDNDAYDQYRWTILSSMNTFSAANDFVCKIKNQSIAKVIGQKSGGGMCSVLPLVLADGTPIAISSNNTSRYMKTNNSGKNIYYSIEHGLSPNMEIPYADFYNDTKLVDYVDHAYEA